MPDLPRSGDALIGHTGFVGSTLKRQRPFTHCYRSSDIHEIRNRRFETVVCAGAPAQKWLANKDPDKDRAAIEDLIGHLGTVHCRRFILISTVDVFKAPFGVDEASPVEEAGLHTYGIHRRRLEQFVQERIADSMIVRLPGLVGPGLRKNVIYDFKHNNNLHAIDARAVFQFYPMVNLWPDIELALSKHLSVVHLTAEPISVAQVALHGFGRIFDQELPGASPARYDLRTRHVALFNGTGPYQYSRRETVSAIRHYAQSEPPRESP